jgi:hypothetical protein
MNDGRFDPPHVRRLIRLGGLAPRNRQATDPDDSLPHVFGRSRMFMGPVSRRVNRSGGGDDPAFTSRKRSGSASMTSNTLSPKTPS